MRVLPASRTCSSLLALRVPRHCKLGGEGDPRRAGRDNDATASEDEEDEGIDDDDDDGDDLEVAQRCAELTGIIIIIIIIISCYCYSLFCCTLT